MFFATQAKAQGQNALETLPTPYIGVNQYQGPITKGQSKGPIVAPPANASQSPQAKQKASAAEDSHAVTASAASLPTYGLLLTDKTIRAALARWQRESGSQISWEVPEDFPVDAEAKELGHSVSAALNVLAVSLQTSPHPIKVREYGNTFVVSSRQEAQ
jgi:hypothetical protein